MNRQTFKALLSWAAMALLFLIATCPVAQSKQQIHPTPSTASVGTLLAGSYDNSGQVAQGKAENPPPRHVLISIQPTQRADWQMWRVHMDVEPEVAQAAGSNTSLDAVWAVNISKVPDQSLELVPYTLAPSVDIRSVKTSALVSVGSAHACRTRSSARAIGCTFN